MNSKKKGFSKWIISFYCFVFAILVVFINLFLSIYREKITHPLQESEVISFIDEALTINVLQRWLNGTNMSELRAQNSLYTLQRFIRKVFVINYDSRNIDMTKSLDRITMNIAVPFRNGKNIASNLQL